VTVLSQGRKFKLQGCDSAEPRQEIQNA